MTQNLACRTMPRVVVVAALITAAVAHIPVIPEHLHEAPYMGVAFIAFTVAATVLAGLVAFADRPWMYAASAALCAAAIGAYVLTRLVAFPELGDDVGNWTETLGLASITAETVALLASLATRVGHPRIGRPLAVG